MLSFFMLQCYHEPSGFAVDWQAQEKVDGANVRVESDHPEALGRHRNERKASTI
jgi:hypothetical protein